MVSFARISKSVLKFYLNNFMILLLSEMELNRKHAGRTEGGGGGGMA